MKTEIVTVRVLNPFIEPPTSNLRKISTPTNDFSQLLKSIYQDPVLRGLCMTPTDTCDSLTPFGIISFRNEVYVPIVTYEDGKKNKFQIVTDDELSLFFNETPSEERILQLEFVKTNCSSLGNPPSYDSLYADDTKNQADQNVENPPNPPKSGAPLCCHGCKASIPRPQDGFYYQSEDNKIQLCKRCYPHRVFLFKADLKFSQVNS